MFTSLFSATQFRSCDDSCGCNCAISHSIEFIEVSVNRTIVTTQRNHHVIWIGWQQGCKHVSQILLSFLGKISRGLNGKANRPHVRQKSVSISSTIRQARDYTWMTMMEQSRFQKLLTMERDVRKWDSLQNLLFISEIYSQASYYYISTST